MPVNMLVHYLPEKLRRPRLLIFLFAVVLALFAYAEVVDDVFYDPQEGDYDSKHFDSAVSQFFNSFRSPLLNQSMTDLTALGSISVIAVLVFIMASILASYRDFKAIGFIVVSSLGALLWPWLLKMHYSRPRPDSVDALTNVMTLSFPSGHAFGATTIYICLAYYAGRYAKGWVHELFFYILGSLLIALVGISRIYLGVHFPTDVLAGISGGVIWGFSVCALYELKWPTYRSFADLTQIAYRKNVPGHDQTATSH